LLLLPCGKRLLVLLLLRCCWLRPPLMPATAVITRSVLWLPWLVPLLLEWRAGMLHGHASCY
jgi:hypothetical protein